ncbi:MAG: hypothetical protein WBA13_16935 [Microcoleaceae cyanobacterium]
MNNGTNRHRQSDDQQLLNWLLQEPNWTEQSPEMEKLRRKDSMNHPTWVNDQLEEELDPLDSEDLDLTSLTDQPFALGEKPVVNNRFETLLKDRLKAEIQRNPPLFPWETELTEYCNYADELIPEEVPPANVWMAQKQNLRWSIPIPESVFAQLLDPCQAVLQSSLREGAKLVKAVEPLFPDQTEPLNQLASLVVRGAVRDGTFLQPQYETAAPEQKMALALLAAQEIIRALTIHCQLDHKPVKQQWLTLFGFFTLEIEYSQRQYGTSLKVLAKLPQGGRLLLMGQDIETSAQRSDDGYLKLEWVNPTPHQLYRLNVLLHDHHQNPLSFVICPEIESSDTGL